MKTLQTNVLQNGGDSIDLGLYAPSAPPAAEVFADDFRRSGVEFSGGSRDVDCIGTGGFRERSRAILSRQRPIEVSATVYGVTGSGRDLANEEQQQIPPPTAQTVLGLVGAADNQPAHTVCINLAMLGISEGVRREFELVFSTDPPVVFDEFDQVVLMSFASKKKKNRAKKIKKCSEELREAGNEVSKYNKDDDADGAASISTAAAVSYAGPQPA